MNEHDGGWPRRPVDIATVVSAVVGVIAVVVAVLAWLLPKAPEPAGAGSAGTSKSAPGPAGPIAGDEPSSGSTPDQLLRFLTDLTPLAGQTNIEVDRAARTYVHHCGSGPSDPSTEVQYQLRGGYREFVAEVVVTEIDSPDAATQYEVFADGTRVANVVLNGESRQRIVASGLGGVDVLTLRLRCSRSGTVVKVEKASVST